MTEFENKAITFSIDSILSSQTQKRKLDCIPEFKVMKKLKDPPCNNILASARKRIVYAKHGRLSLNDETFGCLQISLENKHLWERFKNVGTEMVITKSGRRMFPALRYSISGLNPLQEYIMAIELCSADTYRYKYHESEWCISGKAYPDVKKQNRINIHLDSPSNGAKWNSNVVSFHKSKITNNTSSNKKQIILNSLQKYQPCLHIIEGCNINYIDQSPCLTVIFKETSFIAVTAYQSEQITQLKIDNNPFAKGFRDPNPFYDERLDWLRPEPANYQYRYSINQQYFNNNIQDTYRNSIYQLTPPILRHQTNQSKSVDDNYKVYNEHYPCCCNKCLENVPTHRNGLC